MRHTVVNYDNTVKWTIQSDMIGRLMVSVCVCLCLYIWVTQTQIFRYFSRRSITPKTSDV